MGFFTKIFALLETLSKALEDLSGSIRAAAKSDTARVRVTAELRLTDEEIAQSRADHNEQTSIQRSIRNAAWCAFVAAFVYAGITFCQWQEAQTQTVEANRAWIDLGSPTFQQAAEIKKPVQIQIPYLNIGRRPAMKGKVSVLIDEIDRPAGNGVLDAAKLPRVGEGFCGTNPPDIQVGTIFTEPNPSALRKSSGDFGILWTPQMQSDEKLLRVRACIVYDSFDKPRHTWICKVFWSGAVVQSSPGILVGFNCPDGSGAD